MPATSLKGRILGYLRIPIICSKYYQRICRAERYFLTFSMISPLAIVFPILNDASNRIKGIHTTPINRL